jgi:signal transduction histidine kinase/CheY-like chemotaxis protein
MKMEELLGKSYSPLIYPDDLDVVKKATEDLLNEPYWCAFEERAETIYGWRWISWIAKTIFDENGKISAFIKTGRDITEMKYLMDELLKAKIKAEESDKLKSAFLANMSHEIRTPMNGIIGFLDLLREPDLSEESKNRYIDLVNSGGERLLNTINDIIEISKIEAGQMKVQFSKVNIPDVMEYHYHFFEQQVDKRNVEFRIGKEIIGNGEVILTDKNKLEGMLTNLLRNAIKFTKEGAIKFGNYLEDGNLIFYVRDTGVGIPEDKLDKIFERFVQGDLSSYEHLYEGSGLGLSIVKAYSALMKGKVWVESEVNKGSTFYFSIPYVPEKEGDIVPQKNIITDSYKGMGIKILIVEDDLTSYLLFQTLLNKKEIEVIRVNNGKEALKILSGRNDISLVLMDLRMPVMDGIEATKAIREFNKDIPIIAVTAYALSGDKEMALEAGCDDYISKPINISLLLSKIKNHLKFRNII